MRKVRTGVLALLGMAAFAPASAFAHTGVEHTGGFALGLAHPFGGLDHILLIAAVGIWAARSSSRAAFASAFIAAALFSLFHGLMTGAEGGFSYAAGIVAATAVLSLAGSAAGLMLKRFDRFPLARNAGPVLAALGAILFFV